MALTNRSLSHLGRVLLAALAFASVGIGLQAAGTHYYVNDHLATTVGIADASGEIAALEADAFGSPLGASAAPNRYTGKPYDVDIGAYVFPFRNYRMEEGRWMTADPSGFPDGVNGRYYAPVPISQMDPLGLNIYALHDPNGAGGNGHTAQIIGSGNSFTYVSYDMNSPSTESDNLTTSTHSTFAEALSAANADRASNGSSYSHILQWNTSPSQDADALAYVETWRNSAYNLTTHNCVMAVYGTLQHVGESVLGISHPNRWFNQNQYLADSILE